MRKRFVACWPPCYDGIPQSTGEGFDISAGGRGTCISLVDPENIMYRDHEMAPQTLKH